MSTKMTERGFAWEDSKELGGGGEIEKTYRNFVIIFGCPLLNILMDLSNLNYKYSHLIKHPHNDKNETLISFKWSL